MPLSRSSLVSLRRALALAATLFALAFVAVPARAIGIVAVWDPAYGAPFGDTGWRGRVRLSVPSDCSQPPSGPRPIALPGCGLPWTVTDAKVEFYDLSDPSLTTVETLDFTTQLAVSELHVGPGPGFAINGFATADPSPPASTVQSSVLSPLSTAGVWFALDFELLAGQTMARLFWTSDPGATFAGPLGFEGENAIPGIVRVTEVPVPPTAALVALGLGLSAIAMQARVARGSGRRR